MATEKPALRCPAQKGRQTDFTFTWPTQELALEADILDISHIGIRVKLKHPLTASTVDHIKITMMLPESGTSFSVHGVLKHHATDSEYGMRHHDRIAGSIDDLMFECFELDDATVFIKTH